MCLCVKLTRGQLYWLVLCVNMWKSKLNKPFPPQVLLGHDVCAGIETLTKTVPFADNVLCVTGRHLPASRPVSGDSSFLSAPGKQAPGGGSQWWD